MKKLIRHISLGILISLSSCSKNTNEPEGADYNLELSMGIHCGWDLRQDSISIAADSASLHQNYRVDSNTIKLSASKSLGVQQIKSLKAALDWNYFSALNYNSGDLGSDGCDIWLRIKRGGQSHEIRFSPSDTIPQLRALTDQLDSIWSEMGDFPPEMLDNF